MSRLQMAVPAPFRAVVLAAFLVLVAAKADAQPIETAVDYAILVDFQTGTVLFEKEADARMAPASLAKLMTMAVVFDALREGEITLDDTFRVSENAWRRGGAASGGSTMFAALGSDIRLEDLIRGVIIQSGNDAAITIAEGLAGTEEAFAERMNEEARRLGMEGSRFANATGLPDPDQRVTARDLATLAIYIIREFPEYYTIYSEREFTWNDITQRNRNPLLALDIGADGMKTGFTEESGYGLVASTVRDGRRLVAVINGADSESARATEARRLLDWGYASYRMVTLFEAGDVLVDAAVFGGIAGTVPLRLDGPEDNLLPVDGHDARVEARAVYNGPIEAPIDVGAELGQVVVFVDGAERSRSPLYAATDIEAGPITQRALDALKNLLDGLW
ncbi:MAG: D-alanyl-D-alanine carboxypeptidase family protein [Bauldia sp.]